jgi:hypothetical protein
MLAVPVSRNYDREHGDCDTWRVRVRVEESSERLIRRGIAVEVHPADIPPAAGGSQAHGQTEGSPGGDCRVGVGIEWSKAGFVRARRRARLDDMYAICALCVRDRDTSLERDDDAGVAVVRRAGMASDKCLARQVCGSLDVPDERAGAWTAR